LKTVLVLLLSECLICHKIQY